MQAVFLISRRRTTPTLTLLLLFAGACWTVSAEPGELTPTAPEQPVVAPTPGSMPGGLKPAVATLSKRRMRPVAAEPHRTLAEAIDANVQRLSRGLNLDTSQQDKLRQILWDQHRELRARLVEKPQPGVDRAALTAAIIEHTKEQIRAMLDDEQRSRYSAQVPHGLTAASRADLEHWVEVQNGPAQKAGDASK